MATITKRTWTAKDGAEHSAWRFAVTVPGGRRIRRQYRTKKEAEAALAKLQGEIGSGRHKPDAHRTTLKQVADDWLEACTVLEQTGDMERATLADYQGIVRLHIEAPEFSISRLTLDAITRGTVLDYRDELLASDRSKNTARRALTVLRLILGHAFNRDLIPANPATRVKGLGKKRLKKRIEVPSAADVQAVIQAADDDFQIVLTMAALTGLRASELRGLRWRDISFDEGFVQVRQRADRYGVIGPPKSAAGQRDIPIGDLLKNRLRHWWMRTPYKGLDDLIFPTSTGSVQSHQNWLHRCFTPIFDKLEEHRSVVRFRFHDLRHYAVSRWIAQGFRPDQVKAFAGHSSIVVTYDIYGHMFKEVSDHEGFAEIERSLIGK